MDTNRRTFQIKVGLTAGVTGPAARAAALYEWQTALTEVTRDYEAWLDEMGVGGDHRYEVKAEVRLREGRERPLSIDGELVN